MISRAAAAMKALCFIALTLPLMPVQALLLKATHPAAKKLPKAYHKLLCPILGVKLMVMGEVPQAGLMVSNHVSWLDIVVLSAIAPVSFVAKKEVSTWPFFGSLARLQQTAFVDRERRHATASGVKTLTQRLAGGERLVLFAEGTSGNGRSVLPFKPSYFAAAQAAAVPVVPVTLIYARQRGLPLTLRQWPSIAWVGGQDLLPHLWAFLCHGPVVVKLIIHPALPPESEVSRKDLARSVETTIRRSLAENLHGPLKIG